MNNDRETNPRLKKLQVDLTNLALKLASIAEVNLDFSVESVKSIEEILSKVHYQYKKGEVKEGIRGIALELAAYIVTVIEKNITIGMWDRDSKEFGADSFPYDLGNKKIIFPYIWCLKRIQEGDQDNVWIKFKTLVLDP